MIYQIGDMAENVDFKREQQIVVFKIAENLFSAGPQ